MFPNVQLENLVDPVSDHYPILLYRVSSTRPKRVLHEFKLKNAWRAGPNLNEVVKQWWNSWNKTHRNKLKTCIGGMSGT